MKSEQAEQVLFEDKDVKITDRFVYIKWYYFPFATTKKIPISSIKKVQKRELGWAKARLWGMDASQWGYWLPGDKNRFSRQFFIGITVDSRIKPSFTAEKVDQVYALLLRLVNHRDEQLQKMKEEDQKPANQQTNQPPLKQQ